MSLTGEKTCHQHVKIENEGQHEITIKAFMLLFSGLHDKSECGVAPWFLHTLSSTVTVHQGESLSLQCVVDGDPKPKGQ